MNERGLDRAHVAAHRRTPLVNTFYHNSVVDREVLIPDAQAGRAVQTGLTSDLCCSDRQREWHDAPAPPLFYRSQHPEAGRRLPGLEARLPQWLTHCSRARGPHLCHIFASNLDRWYGVPSACCQASYAAAGRISLWLSSSSAVQALYRRAEFVASHRLTCHSRCELEV